jgi:hypothetical protein
MLCYSSSLIPEESFLYPQTLTPSTKLGAGDFASLNILLSAELGIPNALAYITLSTSIEAALSIGARVFDLMGGHIAAANMWHYRECLNRNREVKSSSGHAAVDRAAAVTDARKLTR